MRVTGQHSHQNRLAELMAAQERLEEARDRVSTGYRVRRPSDAPDQIAELLRTRSKTVELSRRKESIDEMLPTMKASEATLGDITTALREAKTLVMQANNASTSAEQRQVLADQLARIRERITYLGNTQVNGKYIFAGTHVDDQPFDVSNPGAYAGNATPLRMETPDGSPFDASVTGEALRNETNGQDLFGALSALETAVRTGDFAGMADGQGRLDADIDNTIALRGDLGQRLQYAEWASDRLETDLTTQEERRSQIQDADLAEAVTEAARLEYAQQATLAMTARLNGPSLLDYLR